MTLTPIRPAATKFASRVGVVLLIAFVVSGCDVAGIEEDEATLVYDAGAGVGDAIVFSFDPAPVETGVLVDISSESSVDVGAFLNEQGFGKEDIVSATIQTANLELLFPRGETLDFLNTAILKLTAEGRTATEVADRTDFPGDDDANLDVRPGRDVAGYLQAGEFRPVLTIDASRLDEEAEEYELYLVLTLRITVSV